MKAYHIDRFGSIGGIVRRSSEDPLPGPKDVLVRVRASSLNYRDLMVLKGGGRGPTKPGVIPLSDGAGEVAAIGDEVTRVKVGDRIAGCFHPRWFGGPIKPDYLTDRLGANLDGMLAEYAVLSEEALVNVPSHLSFEEAATLPCAAVTAWVALTGHRSVTAGDTVLTLGSGGVSVFALQLAKLLGARVIATTSTAEKAERLKALGATDVINYTETPGWDAITGRKRCISISVGSRTDFEAMNRAIELHRLRPVIDRTFPFGEAKEAYRRFEGRAHFGKIVIAHG